MRREVLKRGLGKLDEAPLATLATGCRKSHKD